MRPHHRNPNNKLLFSTSTLLILGALAALLHNSASAESDTRRWKNRWNFMCVDLDIAGGVHNGSKVQSWTCNGWDNQHWYYHDDGTITNQLGRCLDLDVGSPIQNGSRVQIWDCNGWDNQKWWHDGESFRSIADWNKCLDEDSATRARDGKQLQVWDCNGRDNQRFYAE